MIIVSRSSDRKLERRYHVAIPAIVAAGALVLLGATSFPLLFPDPLILLGGWRLQLFCPFLGTTQRVSDGVLGGSRHRFN